MSAYQAHDSISASSTTAVLTLPSFALTGSNRNLVVGTGLRVSSARTISSIVRGSDTFESKASSHQPNSQLLVYNSTNEPQTSTATLAITIDSATGTWSAGYIASDTVNQTTRFNGLQSDLGTSVATGTASGTVTSAVGDLICTALCVSNVTSLAATGTGHTKRIDEPITTQGEFAMGSAPGAASLAVGYSWDSATISKVFYGWNHPTAAGAPVGTVPASGMCINTYEETAVPGISVAAGSSPITSVATTCTTGCTLTYDTTGTSVTVSGNGTNAATLLNGASEAEWNTVLDTLTMRGTTPDTTITVTVIPIADTLTDNDQFTVLCDPASITISGTNANVISAVGALQIRLLPGQSHDTISVNVVDDTGGTPLESDSEFIVGLSSYFQSGSHFLLSLFRRRRRS